MDKTLRQQIEYDLVTFISGPESHSNGEQVRMGGDCVWALNGLSSKGFPRGTPFRGRQTTRAPAVKLKCLRGLPDLPPQLSTLCQSQNRFFGFGESGCQDLKNL